MKYFSTLRGFLQGDEKPDVDAEFRYYATLRIAGEILDFDGVSAALGLTPTVAVRRGERIGPRSPPAREDLWMFTAPVAESHDIAEHLDVLWQRLEPHVNFIHQLKRVADVEVVLGYASNIDHAGLRLPYRSLAMFLALEVDVVLNVVVIADE